MPLLERMRQILDTVMEKTRDVETVDKEVGNLLKTILEKKAAMEEILVAAPVRRRDSASPAGQIAQHLISRSPARPQRTPSAG